MALPNGLRAVHVVEDGPHVDVVGQHQRLDAAAQAAQAERRHGLPQVGRAGDVAAPLIEAEGDLSNRSSRIGYLAHRAKD
jgi:hypothetical protein